MGNRKRVYKVKDLTKIGANALMFHNEVLDQEQSVAEYFEGQYKLR